MPGSKGQLGKNPEAEQHERRKSNHGHIAHHTRTLPIPLKSATSAQQKQMQSDHRSKQLQSRPPDTVTQLVCTFEMRHRHVVLIWWREAGKQAAVIDCETGCESECRVFCFIAKVYERPCGPAVQRPEETSQPQSEQTQRDS